MLSQSDLNDLILLCIPLALVALGYVINHTRWCRAEKRRQQRRAEWNAKVGKETASFEV